MLRRHAIDFYADYEVLGEPGVELCRAGDGERLRLWEGFFRSIMLAVLEGHRAGRAPYGRLLGEWNECKGFAGASFGRTQLPLDETLSSLRAVDLAVVASESPVGFARLSEVLEAMIAFLEAAQNAGQAVTIEEI